ncbi:hypothetical protein DAPPUDRAFT_241056 [Daphnia pulex]|uniref:Uncharacterized protein n=1 Tax=Daphnia pulex TaxID=6669 RepID=E9GDB3_DAPPU|nr:hypothetical protein DAPPUDRAFT_241056 [Daphnia pulex]|eukprot:EFX82726.1 hypothetical protein DAPPUDRAFT_241056 [Daphnia pulex]
MASSSREFPGEYTWIKTSYQQTVTPAAAVPHSRVFQYFVDPVELSKPTQSIKGEI